MCSLKPLQHIFYIVLIRTGSNQEAMPSQKIHTRLDWNRVEKQRSSAGA